MIFWEEDEVCGCRNKCRGPIVGTSGSVCALDPRGQVLAPPAVFLVPDILKYSRKNHTKFSGRLENFYFRGIFCCMDNSENRQIILFLLYLF